MAPATSKPSEKAITGEKRTRDAEDLPPRQARRGTYFVDGTALKPKRSGPKPTPTPDAVMEEVQNDATRAREAAKAEREARELKDQAMINDLAGTRKAKRDGNVCFFKNASPRFSPSSDMFSLLFKDKSKVAFVSSILENGGDFIWAQVFNQPNPDEVHFKRLRAAIRHIAELGFAEGVEAQAYDVHPIPKANGKAYANPILIICASATAARSLVNLGHFAFRDPQGESACFTQGAVSHGSAVIIDIKNAPLESSLVMAGVWKNFNHLIKWKTKDDNAWVPEAFQYTRVEGPKTAKDAAVAHWRIAFAPDVDIYRKWTMPETIGVNGLKGEVILEDPPFCPHCISPSHAKELCIWWRTPGFAGAERKPKDFATTKWIVKKVFGSAVRKGSKPEKGAPPPSESESEADAPPSRTPTPGPRPGPSSAVATKGTVPPTYS